MLEALRRTWWALLAIGVVSIVIGLIAMFMPVAALTAIVLLAAVFTLVTGVFAIIGGIQGISHDVGGWLELLWGLLGVGLGLFVIFQPKTGAVVLFLLYGIWAILRGAVEVIAAIRLRSTMPGWVVTLIAGLAWLALGVLFLIAPTETAVAVTIVWGAFVLVIGIMTIIYAAFAHRAIHDLEDQESIGSTAMQA